MTRELTEAKQALSETFQRMRLIEARAFKSIVTLQEADEPLTMAKVLERLRQRTGAAT